MANRVFRDTTKSDKVNKLSPEAEVFFYRLMMKADDHGCFHGNPKLLRTELFPLRIDDGAVPVKISDVVAWVNECIAAQLIVKYEAEGKGYLFIHDFGQRLRTMRRNFPPPPEDIAPSIDSNPPSTNGLNRNEEEEKGKRKEVEGEIKTNFFRIKDKLYREAAGDYFKRTNSVFLEQWQMSHPKEKIVVQVLHRMNTSYIGHQFNDEQHIRNTFKHVWGKVLKDPTATSNQATTFSFKDKKGYNPNV